MSTPAAQTVTSSPWAAHRRRGKELLDRHGYAAQVLSLYLALLDAWEDAWRLARADPPAPRLLAGWAVEYALAPVVAATVRLGPLPLAEAVDDLYARGAVGPLLTAWLDGAQPPPVERYLARAVLRGPLEAVDPPGLAGPAVPGSVSCPRCGGRPQLSFRANADDRLVSGRRQLACDRCARSWAYSGSACASCGETTGARRTVFAEHHGGPVVGRGDGTAALFPHLRIESCESCSRYLIDIDLGRDARAVPEVDELAAVPLDLYATERGLTKIAPNLMGF